MKNYIKKLLDVPAGETTVTAFEIYEVRWTSRYDVYSHSIKPEAEIFPLKEDAETFAAALENAFKLIKYTGANTKVTVNRREP